MTHASSQAGRRQEAGGAGKATDAGPEITFFVPCLNEESNVLKTIHTILDAVAEVPVSHEILVIDDCSTDRTVELAETFAREHPGTPLRLQKNRRTRGLGRNFVEGAFMGSGRYYMLVNGDNAEPKEAITSILRELGKADMVIPHFGTGDRRTGGRRFLSRVFTGLVNFISGHRVPYYNGSVAHLRWNVMRWHADTDGYAYQAEIITRILDEGGTFVPVLIPNADRQAGVSKAFKFRNVLAVCHSLLQMFLRRLRRVMFRNEYDVTLHTGEAEQAQHR